MREFNLHKELLKVLNKHYELTCTYVDTLELFKLYMDLHASALVNPYKGSCTAFECFEKLINFLKNRECENYKKCISALYEVLFEGAKLEFENWSYEMIDEINSKEGTNE